MGRRRPVRSITQYACRHYFLIFYRVCSWQNLIKFRPSTKRYRNRCLCWPRKRPGCAPGGGGSMATADHEATGGADAVRVSADAENATAIGQSTRTASCIQTPIERRESCVVVLTPLAEHRSCHHLKSKSYIDIALYCIKYCTFVVLHDGILHAHGAMQNRVPAETLAGTIAGIAALPARTTIRLEDPHRASRADARGRARPQFLAVSRCAPSTAAGGREQIGSP